MEKSAKSLDRPFIDRAGRNVLKPVLMNDMLAIVSVRSFLEEKGRWAFLKTKRNIRFVFIEHDVREDRLLEKPLLTIHLRH
jgi:hypothetical protein